MLRVQHFPLSQVPDQLEASGKYEKAYLFRGISFVIYNARGIKSSNN